MVGKPKRAGNDLHRQKPVAATHNDVLLAVLARMPERGQLASWTDFADELRTGRAVNIHNANLQRKVKQPEERQDSSGQTTERYGNCITASPGGQTPHFLISVREVPSQTRLSIAHEIIPRGRNANHLIYLIIWGQNRPFF